MVINVRRLHKGLDFEITEYVMISQTAHSSCCVANAACGKLVREDSAQWSTKTAQNKWHRRAAAPQPLRPWAGNFVSLTMSLYGGSLYVTAFISWPGAEIGSREKEKHKGMDNRNQDICCLYFFLCLLDSTVARKKLAEGAKHRMVRSCMPNALSHCLRRWNQFGSVMIKLPFLLYLFTVSQIHLSDRFPSYM